MYLGRRAGRRRVAFDKGAERIFPIARARRHENARQACGTLLGEACHIGNKAAAKEGTQKFRIVARRRIGAARDPRVGGSASRRVIPGRARHPRSEEHTSELQSLMRISYAVFCLKTNTTEITPRKL